VLVLNDPFGLFQEAPNAPFPTNGYEPQYDPGPWNDPDYPDDVSATLEHPQYHNNCYTYACNDEPLDDSKKFPHGKDPGGKIIPPFYFPVWPFYYPGKEPTTGIDGPGDFKPEVNCKRLEEAMKIDGHEPFPCDKPCPCGKSRVYVIVDPDRDYHVYRQDKDGDWSHKPGKLFPVDRHGPDPRKRDGDFKDYKDCGCFCVERDK
jgi:hypothetical protein